MNTPSGDPVWVERFLTDHEVADILGIGVRTVWKWAAMGRLPTPVRIGGSLTRWKASELKAYIDKLPRQY